METLQHYCVSDVLFRGLIHYSTIHFYSSFFDHQFPLSYWNVRPGLQDPLGSVRALLLQKEPEGQGEQLFRDVPPTDRLTLPIGHGDGTDEPSTQ